MHTDNRCRLCKNQVVDVLHIISSCSRMSSRYYFSLRHDAIAKYVYEQHHMKLAPGCKVEYPADEFIHCPANISTWDQRCFNVVDQRWNNVDLTLKMKQNLTSDFHRCITLMQHRCTTLLKKFPQRRIKLSQRCFKVDMTLSQPCFNVVSTLVKAISNPIPLAINMEVWICK